MSILIFFVAHWYLSLFSQTFYLHRYAAHKMFTMSPFWEKVFHIFSYITQGSSYLSPYAYGILHRLHHAYADTEKDPHSPKYDLTMMSMMWRTKNIYNDIFHGRADIDPKFKKGVPRWKALDLLGDNYISRIGWMVAYTTFYIFFATQWWMFLLLPIHFVMGPVHGAIINWFAHKYGYVNYKVNDTSKNFLPLDLIMMGESYHNNHHTFKSRPNFGVRWFELDPTYPVIKVLHWMNIIKLKPQQKLAKA